jgi:Secretion system C-terminal sorting domain
MKVNYYFILLLFTFGNGLNAQTAWPSITWNSATNLTSVMDAAGINEASGLYWNTSTERLYLVQNSGRVRVLQYSSSTNSFSQLANKSISGGPEGITLANNTENAFYTIDENNYEIRKYTHTADFGTVTATKSWNLLALPSTMTNTGNTGPEGICFISDSYLTSSGFISQNTGLPYTSQKGMGGLIFIAHQDEGYIWVFDLNPTVNNDFLFVGKYQTNRTESCDLSFDSSTGLLYILHNVDGNRLEVTNLASTVNGTVRKFTVVNEYFLPVPSTNVNIEGFALTNKCPATNTVSAWLCRDASSTEGTAILTDVLRWFSPFASEGSCLLASSSFENNTISVYPNPVDNLLKISNANFTIEKLEIYNLLGEKIISKTSANSLTEIDVSNLNSGVYFIMVTGENKTDKTTFVKK